MAALSASRRRWIGTAGALLLGGVLLIAAWTKAIDPEAFAAQITAEGLDRWLPAGAVALIAIGLEVAIGTALVVGVRRRWVLVPAALLVAFFLFLTGRAYLADLRGIAPAAEACGCFGNLIDRTPAEAFWQDLLLLVPALAAAFVGMPERLTARGRRLTVVAAVTLGALALAWRAPELPLDDLATRLHPGVETRELCVGKADDPEHICLDALVPELDDGEHWVVLTGLDEPAMIDAIPDLHEHTLIDRSPRLWLVSDVEPEALNVFTWQHMMATEVRLVPTALMTRLHRRLPRSFRVVDGRVVETISGLPRLQAAEERAAAR